MHYQSTHRGGSPRSHRKAFRSKRPRKDTSSSPQKGTATQDDPSSETGSHTLSNENIPVATEQPQRTVENAIRRLFTHDILCGGISSLLKDQTFSPCVPFQDAFTECSPDLHTTRLDCASDTLPRIHHLRRF